WRYEGEDLMEMCKLAVETCYWPLFEVIDGEWKLSYRPKVKLPVEEFLKKQGRFKHLFKPQNRHIIDRIQKDVDLKWERLLKRCGEEL
ncbi:MAG: pyruvate ferredoxin oxidoreductase, partial [Fusobacterium ulcerans]